MSHTASIPEPPERALIVIGHAGAFLAEYDGYGLDDMAINVSLDPVDFGLLPATGTSLGIFIWEGFPAYPDPGREDMGPSFDLRGFRAPTEDEWARLRAGREVFSTHRRLDRGGVQQGGTVVFAGHVAVLAPVNYGPQPTTPIRAGSYSPAPMRTLPPPAPAYAPPLLHTPAPPPQPAPPSVVYPVLATPFLPPRATEYGYGGALVQARAPIPPSNYARAAYDPIRGWAMINPGMPAPAAGALWVVTPGAMDPVNGSVWQHERTSQGAPCGGTSHATGQCPQCGEAAPIRF